MNFDTIIHTASSVGVIRDLLSLAIPGAIGFLIREFMYGRKEKRIMAAYEMIAESLNILIGQRDRDKVVADLLERIKGDADAIYEVKTALIAHFPELAEKFQNQLDKQS